MMLWASCLNALHNQTALRTVRPAPPTLGPVGGRVRQHTGSQILPGQASHNHLDDAIDTLDMLRRTSEAFCLVFLPLFFCCYPEIRSGYKKQCRPCTIGSVRRAGWGQIGTGIWPFSRGGTMYRTCVRLRTAAALYILSTQ